MFKGIATGKNKNYGEKGEKVYISNDSLRYCKKNDILRDIKYAGSGRLVIRDAETGEEIR